MMNLSLSLRSRLMITTTAGGAAPAFSPADLFASGEEGAWYEPSTTTAFRSTTDLTPCGYGDSCGFLLDLSKGAGYSGGSFTGLGSELVTNGTFDTNSVGWDDALGASRVTVAGEVLVTGGTQFGIYQKLTGLTIGATYYLSGDGRVGTGTDVRLRITSDATLSTTRAESNIVTATGSNEQMSLTFVAQETNPAIYLRTSGNGDTGYFDNISVRELPGNHAVQGTESARPILARVPSTGRRNLLDPSNDLSQWSNIGTSDTQNVSGVTSPDGGETANSLTENTANSLHYITAPNASYTSGTAYTASVYVKANGRNKFSLTLPQTEFPSADRSVDFDLSAEIATPIGTLTGEIENVGGGWYRCSITQTAATSGIDYGLLILLKDDAWNATYTGDGTSGLYIWGAQLEAASSATAYQKVVDQYDITEAGVTSLEYLDFDGADDRISIPSPGITTATDVDVMIGLDPGADAAYMMFSTSNNVIFAFTAEDGVTSSTHISAGTPSLFVDGVAITDTRDALHDALTGAPHVAEGQGFNLSTWGLETYLMSYQTSSFFRFDGKLFCFLVREGMTAEELTNARQYVAAKSGVTL